VQYGLIAEEVDKVYPELVIHGTNGRIEGVRYDELAPMLLNEVQKQQRTLTAQAERMTAQEQVITAAAQQLRDMQAQLAEVKELKQQIADLQHGRSVHASMDIRQPKVEPIDSL
jgi:polyhydroxyalkanoate synthesis regulator phasin